VARVNPVPTLSATANGANATPVIAPGVSANRWHLLPLYDFTTAPFGFFSSTIGFSADEARNFFIMNPTWARSLYGDSNANVTPFMYYMNGMADARSIGRYGFRPELGTTRWLADLLGNAASVPSLNVPGTVAMLTARLAAWWEPLPLMARGQVTIPFSPDVLPGCRFRYYPYKGQAAWDFYIEGVRHSFTFGSMSSTTLTLSRGLPQAVYDNASSGSILEGLHLGTVIRDDFGDYVIATGQAASTPALTAFSTPEQVHSFLSSVANIYVTPQGGAG
jgi:hypothetical protein